MDAPSILERFESKPGSMNAQVQHDAVLSEVTIHKVMLHGMVFSGAYIPRLNATVTVRVDDLSVEGVVSARTVMRGAILFMRPVDRIY